MTRLKARIEKRTGILWGTYRTSHDPLVSSWFWMRLGGGRAGYVPLEIGTRGRAFYVTGEPK